MNICLFVGINDNVDRVAIKECLTAIGQMVGKNQIKVGCKNHSAVVPLLLSASNYHASFIFDDNHVKKMKYDAGIFIGGDETMKDDFVNFYKEHPEAKLLPVPTTGGYAKELFKKYLVPLTIPRDLEYGSQYYTMFTKILRVGGLTVVNKLD